MTQVAGTTLPRKIPGGIAELGVVSFPGIEQILHVSQDSTYGGPADGTMRHPYTTIGAAVAAANALTPAEDNRILVFVWTGIYAEQVTLADDFVYLAGIDRNACVVTRANGAGEYTLTVTADYYAVWTLTFVDTNLGGPASFQAGASVEDAQACECVFHCASATSSDVAVTSVDADSVCFKDCDFYHVAVASFLALSTKGEVDLIGCRGHVGYVTMSSGGGVTATLRVVDCIFFTDRGAGALDINSPGAIHVRGSTLVGSAADACTFRSQPGDAVFIGNYLEASGGRAIDASVAMTGITIEDNIMVGGGISPNISHVKPERIVGASGMKDWYASFADACASVTFSDIVIKLKINAPVPVAIDPAPSYDLTVDGCGQHTLGTAGVGVLVVRAGFRYVLRDCVLLSAIFLQSGACVIRLERCAVRNVTVYGDTSASRVEVIDCTPNPDNLWAYQLVLYSDNPDIIIKRSRLKGWAAFAAIYFGASHTKLKVQDSTIVHGSLGVNNPFTRPGAQVVTYRSTGSLYNTDPQAAGWATNLVAPAQRFDSYDANGDY